LHSFPTRRSSDLAVNATIGKDKSLLSGFFLFFVGVPVVKIAVGLQRVAMGNQRNPVYPVIPGARSGNPRFSVFIGARLSQSGVFICPGARIPVVFPKNHLRTPQRHPRFPVKGYQPVSLCCTLDNCTYIRYLER